MTSPDKRETRPVIKEGTKSTEALIADAKIEALIWAETPEAKTRVIKAIDRRLKPYIEENKIISEGLSGKYREHIGSVVEELGTRIGGDMCSDGRLPLPFYYPPIASGINRTPGGFISTRHSSFHPYPDLRNTYVKGSIAAHVKYSKELGKELELTEFIGAHLDSHDPVKHRCGALGIKAGNDGYPREVALEYGGIEQYFRITGDSFYSYSHIAKNAGGFATPFSAFQDTYSAALILGLREGLYDQRSGRMNFDRNKSLRKNLIQAHDNHEVLMVEFLAQEFEEIIFNKIRIKKEQGMELKDFGDPRNLANNLITVDTVALDIIKEERKKGYPWIPDSLKDGKSPKAVDTLAFIAMRNAGIIVSAGFRPGDNPNIDHHEWLVRVGPVGADHNIRVKPFTEATPRRGEFSSETLDAVVSLYGLAEQYFPENGIDLKEEARTIVVTGVFDASKLTSRFDALQEFEETSSEVRGNTRIIRERFPDAVKNGLLTAIPTLYKRDTRELTHILLPNANMD